MLCRPLYPAINDLRHGFVSGLRHYAPYRGWSNATFDAWLAGALDPKKPRREGFMHELANPAFPTWRALDLRYDQCVGSFKCSPERDDPGVAFSVRFSCLDPVPPSLAKPSRARSEDELMRSLQAADGHTRYWVGRWYGTLSRAMGGPGLPPPLWEGEPLPAAPPPPPAVYSSWPLAGVATDAVADAAATHSPLPSQVTCVTDCE